jgi:hypothetical protein
VPADCASAIVCVEIAPKPPDIQIPVPYPVRHIAWHGDPSSTVLTFFAAPPYAEPSCTLTKGNLPYHHGYVLDLQLRNWRSLLTKLVQQDRPIGIAGWMFWDLVVTCPVYPDGRGPGHMSIGLAHPHIVVVIWLSYLRIAPGKACTQALFLQVPIYDLPILDDVHLVH